MSVVVNELLCYVQNNIDKHPRALVCVAINGFYSDDEVTSAKQCLYGIIVDFKLDGCARLIKRQAGDNKRKLECEDILNLFGFVDGSSATLPTFAAVNLLRLPTVSPSDVDVYSLAASVSTMAEKLEVVSHQIQKLESYSNRVEKLEAVQRGAVMGSDTLSAAADFPPVSAASTSSAMSYTSVSGVSNGVGNSGRGLWAELVDNLGPDDFSVVINKKHGKQVKKSSDLATRMVRGKATNEGKFTASHSHGSWHVFVSRVHPDTTADDIHDFLTDNGIRVVKCKKLEAKEEWQKNSAAFHLSVHEDDRDKVYVADLWPVNVQVRDWYFKNSAANNVVIECATST